jgi:enterochelin esterase-like enzyme
MVGSAVAALVAASALAAPPLPGWTHIDTGPDGGSVWQGVIPSPGFPGLRRDSAVYLPPGYPGRSRYPLLVVLHGFRGAPDSIVFGLRFAQLGDAEIASGRSRPFVAVMPVAGTSSRYDGEWAGPWERWVVGDVVPWARRSLPVLGGRADRAIAGYSAGGYGAVDIGLRHPRLFGTLESWSGYFRPFADGPLRGASRAVLAAHEPTRLAAREARLLRRLGTRFYLSCGSTHDRITAAWARTFDRELVRLRLPHDLVLRPGGHDGRFWRAQLPTALDYAFDARVTLDAANRDAAAPDAGRRRPR